MSSSDKSLLKPREKNTHILKQMQGLGVNLDTRPQGADMVDIRIHQNSVGIRVSTNHS